MPRTIDPRTHRPPTRWTAVGLALASAATLALSACGSPTIPTTVPIVVASPPASTSPQPSSSDLPSGSTEPTATIPQPAVGELPIRPDDERVDLATPTFSSPTEITNPLFPVSRQASVLLLGEVDDMPFRTEVTLLPETRIIEWNGVAVEVLVSQYVAYLGGRIHEVAYDFYAQADDGSVWYFGEDVFNFADGAIVDTHGTWIAGKDGPAAMIMPGDPTVGDVYRPENIPGLVFEEVVVKAVDQPLDGPLGPVAGGLVIEELHMDGAREAKTFAPAYGEFYTSGGGDTEALALAVPTDAAGGPVPADLTKLERGAWTVFDAGVATDWATVDSTVGDMVDAWNRTRVDGVPVLIEPILDNAILALTAAAEQRDSPAVRRAAIDVARSTLDLELRHRPVTEVDLARFDLWLAQMLVDAAANDAVGLRAGFFSLDYVRDRIASSLPSLVQAEVNLQLESLLAAVADEDFDAVDKVATGLRSTIVGS